LGIAAQANAKIEALEKRVKSLEGLLDDDDKGKGKK
jgi:BMFP domain-containing protein YqiC